MLWKNVVGLGALLFVFLIFIGCPSPTGDDSDRDTTPPGPVTELAATAGNGQVLLSWTGPEDGDLDHIEIEWSPGDADPVRVDPGEEEYLVAGLTNGTPYTFLLVSVDNAGNRSDAADVSATPQDDGTTDDDTDADDTDDPDPTDSEWTIDDVGSDISWTEDTAPELTWDAVDGAGSYEVQFAESAAAITTGTVLSSSSLSLKLTESLGNNTEHQWRVRGVDGSRKSEWSATYTVEVQWDDGIATVRAWSGAEVRIDWQAVTGAVEYEIQVTRNEDFLENALVRTVADNEYVYDGTLSEDQELYWRRR